MNGFLLAIITLAPVALIVASFPWIASRVRRHGLGAGLLEPIQDLWDPTVHRTQIELHIQAERQEPSPSPDDPLRR